MLEKLEALQTLYAEMSKAIDLPREEEDVACDIAACMSREQFMSTFEVDMVDYEWLMFYKNDNYTPPEDIHKCYKIPKNADEDDLRNFTFDRMYLACIRIVNKLKSASPETFLTVGVSAELAAELHSIEED